MSSPMSKYPSISANQSGRMRHIAAVVLLLAWLAAMWLASVHRQDIIDWWRLRNYQAPQSISRLADQDTMTDYGRKIFYVNNPLINDKATFHTKCPNNGGEQTIVLGCYIGNQAGIFLLAVSDSRLDGIVQVTAAHEMLHGAYDRLSTKERNRVDAMLADYYKNQLHDQRILDTLDAYKKSEPRDVVNEMHSIFGTEVATLPAGLEQYYKQYFTDRSKVAGFAAQYQAAFTSRKAAIAGYDTQLASLKDQIAVTEADLKTKHSAIEAQQSSLVSLRTSGNIAAYNAGVPAYNSLVDSYNQQVETIKSLITQYNQLVATRNAIAVEQASLTKELSSDAAPIQP